jgi:GNAT superfamily N-acetyltransferase
MPTLLPFSPSHHAEALGVWHAALPDFPISARFLAYNLTPATGETLAGRVAILHGELVGFTVVSALAGSALGWVSALVVHPAHQRQGVGAALLAWGEEWLREQGCARIRLGGNLRPFMPGIPAPDGGAEGTRTFFEKFGYHAASQPYEYDVARSLKDYRPLYAQPAHTDLAPAQPGEEPLLLDFLTREFPGRWAFEVKEFINNGGRMADFLLLRVAGAVHGFCWLTREDSERPIERFYPQRLPRPWGQLGTFGVSKALRGQGLGGYLVDAAALHLQSQGVNGCVIDWTSLVDFYGKFGFSVYQRYISLFKG